MMKESSEKLNNQAINLAAEGHFDEAIACLKRAIIVEQDNYLLWFNLGITYRDMGKFQLARESLERAFEMMPEDPEIVCELANLCLILNQKTDALYFCSIGLNFDDSNAKIWNTLGVIAFNMEDFEFASHAFEEAISLNPFYYDAIYNLHDTYQELKNKAGVEECNRILKTLEGQN